ncbi:protein Rf1, mitochondrial-like [Rosa sericea]
MADTPNSSDEDLKKHLMKVYEDVTKDCEDKELRKIFDWIVDYDALNANAIHMFSSLADCGFRDEARELFKPHSEQTTLPEVAVFTMVIMAYAANGKTKDAHKVYQQMIASGVTPTAYTYTLIICGMAKDFSDSNFVGYAKKYFLEMLDRGMKPQYQPYMYVMDAIAYREPVEEAKKFLEQIKAKGFVPVIDDFQYKENHLTEALQAMKTYADLVVNNNTDKAVQKLFRESRLSPWIERSMEVHKALVEDGNVDEAIELYHTIQQTGVEPLVQIHTSVIKAYLKFGKTKGALEAYLAMLAAGVTPNSYTYTVLIKGLCADPNFFGDAKKYLLEMMDKGKQPNVAAYTAVIEGFVLSEDKTAEEKGKEFVEMMMGKGFVPNAKAMMKVLKGKPTVVIRRVMNIVLSKLKS